MHATNIVFFGGEPLAVPALEKLKAADLLPRCVVCNPDRPQGRKQIMTAPPAKEWALQNNIDVFQPESLGDPSVQAKLSEMNPDIFVVVAYSALIPKTLLDIPMRGALNAHPSLLPKFRGPSPIRSAILADERHTGTTIILLDEKMDHGPILAQEELPISEDEWPLRGTELDARLADLSGSLLANTIPQWLAGEIKPREQDHEHATYTKKITKADGELDLSDDPYTNLLKIRAFDGWPGTFFFAERGGKQIRVKVTDAELAPDGTLKILRVVPEGKQEMHYQTFQSAR